MENNVYTCMSRQIMIKPTSILAFILGRCKKGFAKGCRSGPDQLKYFEFLLIKHEIHTIFFYANIPTYKWYISQLN